MIRLLSIQPVAERGGSDQALLRMLRGLPSDEFECHVVVPSEPPLRQAFEESGIAVHVVPMRRISRSHGLGDWAAYAAAWPFSVTRLRRLIRRLDPDIVHTNSLHSWYGWAAAGRRPHVWHAREIVVQSDKALRVERYLTAHHADRVIAMSHAIADQLDPTNVVVVYETVDTSEFSPDFAGRFRERVSVPDDAPVLGAVGRIDTWKGIDVLFAAWPQVKAPRPDAHLVVIGGPVRGKERYFDELGALASSLDDVHWLGPRDDVAELYADLDVFVLPSTEPEPYGLVMVEALASGVPVVATDHGGPPEILARARPGAGRLVPPRDPAALAAAIIDSLQASGPTSTALRRARSSLRVAEPEAFADVFRTVVEGAQARG